jgi:hypothetical protein
MLGCTDRALAATGSAITGYSHQSSRGGNQPVASSVPDCDVSNALFVIPLTWDRSWPVQNTKPVKDFAVLGFGSNP